MAFDCDMVIGRTRTDSIKWAFRENLSPEQFAADPFLIWVTDLEGLPTAPDAC